jgi:plasmid stabilization system protein ParE
VPELIPEWRQTARDDLLAIIDTISDDNPAAAQPLKEDKIENQGFELAGVVRVTAFVEALVRTGLTPHNLPADCSNDRADECSTWTNSSKAAISFAK